MATGDQDDIQSRLQSVVPPSWFGDSAPTETATLSGFAAIASWAYSLISFAKLQMRLATAVGMFIDLWSFDYLGLNIRRKASETDDQFRVRVKSEVLRLRVTREGVSKALEDLTGYEPIIFEPWNTGDAGAWNIGQWGWSSDSQSGGGAGGWGTQLMPNQALIKVFLGGYRGVANIGGWGGGSDGSWTPTQVGWNVGAGEWISMDIITGQVTNLDVYNTINLNKPTGVGAWVQILPPPAS